MKRIFKLVHPKTKVPRLVEGAVSDIRKYLKRERKKDIPENADFWDFECRCGPTESEAESSHVDDVGKLIGEAAEKGLESFYVEINARAVTRKISNRERRIASEKKSRD
ncbi:MAG: hypothetical protein ACI97A_003194 [Planctomycetota bacterium]|jgi:hypothetical protein